MNYISVHNWRKFQHYDPAIRVPPWIKNNLELMADDAYLGLTEHRALMLHRLWLEYASSRCRLSDDTAMLSQRLAMKVMRPDIDALNHAGFIDIVASVDLADGASASRAREEVEVEVETPKPPFHEKRKPASARRAEAWIRNGLAREIPLDRLADVIADEFHLDDPELVAELVSQAQERRH